MGAVVAVALLIVVAVVALMAYSGWFHSYSTRLYTEVETKPTSGVILDYIDKDKLYVKAIDGGNITVNNVKIGGIDCQINGSISGTELNTIDLGFCTASAGLGVKEVVLITDQGVFSKYLTLSSIIVGNLTASLEPGTSCPPGDARIFGMNDSLNSHAELGTSETYPNSVCLSHNGYTLGNDCSAVNHVELFTLDGVTNSHIWFDTNAAIAPLSNPNSVCISSSGGVIDFQKTTSMTSGYFCLASYVQDDLMGGIVGDCGAYPDLMMIQIN